MFEYKGNQYTLADLQASAKKQGYENFDEFLQAYKDAGLKEVSAPTTMGSDTLGAPLTGGSMGQPKERAASNWFGDAWFAGEINAFMRPLACMVPRAGEAFQAGDIGHIRRGQAADGGDQPCRSVLKSMTALNSHIRFRAALGTAVRTEKLADPDERSLIINHRT